MDAIEKTIQFDAEGTAHISLGKDFSNKSAKVIILTDSDITDKEWMQAISKNPVFDFLKDEGEDIYSLQDGKPFSK